MARPNDASANPSNPPRGWRSCGRGATKPGEKRPSRPSGAGDKATPAPVVLKRMLAPSQMRRRMTGKRWTRVLVGLGALLLLGASVAGRAEPADSRETRARALGKRLIAPCCFTQTIDQHESEAARQMQTEVRQLLTQGLSDEQVLDFYVQRYGTRILAVPPPQGFNQLLYWMPFIALLGLFVGGCLTLWKWYRRSHSIGSPA